jgi:fumarate reductase flavoprotein subunit
MMWLLLSACVEPQYEAPGEPTESSAYTEQHDIVIIGAGPAGLAAASRLQGGVQSGLVLEGSDTIGGRLPPGSGELLVVGSQLQADEGVSDSVEGALSEWTLTTGAAATAATELYLEETPTIHDHLVDLGVVFAQLSPSVLGETPRGVLISSEGSDLTEALLGDVPPTVEIRTGAWVDELIVENGRVVGVVVGESRIGAGAVIIATGGFTADETLVAENVDGDTLWEPTAPEEGASGAALRWADTHGWQTAALSAIGWHYVNLGIADETGRAIPLEFDLDPPWIWVNQAGSRFVNESTVFSLKLSAAVSQQEATWGIGAWEDIFQAAGDHSAVEDAGSSGALPCSSDVHALATSIGMDPQALEQTLDRVQAHIAERGVDEFGRAGDSFPLLEGQTLCAFPLGVRAAKAFGGLNVDSRSGALTRDGATIEGLFVAGEAAGMGVPGMGGIAGFDGSVSAIIWSGWRAGAAAQDSLDEDEP